MSAHILGPYHTQSKIHFPSDYFIERDCWIDCRTPDMIEIHPTANVGWEVKMVVQTHNPMPGMFGNVTSRPIKIGAHAFIAGFATLYNCDIGEGAIVALGSVVRSQKLEPWCMYAGNPAVMIKRYNHETKIWEKV